MAEWERAIEKQAATWAFYVDPNGKGQNYLDGFLQRQERVEPANTALLSHLRHNVISTLWNADPVYVTHDMMALLEASWPEFQPEPLHEDDVFIPFGFVYLPRPVVIKDWRGNPVSHRAIGWLPAERSEDGARASFVTTWCEAEDAITDERQSTYEDATLAAFRMSQLAGLYRRTFGQAMVLNYASPMMYGMTVDEMLERHDFGINQMDRALVEDSERNHDAMIPATTELLRFLQALWRLMGQRVAVGMSSRPSRPARRQLAREHPTYPEKYVTVITLRRPKGEPTGDHRSIDWSMRWIVSGHWRWQPYKDGTHRQIWIAPYTKGPEDKPLVVRGARVFRLAR